MEAAADYWREVVRLGVLALGFCVVRTVGEPILAAEFTGPLQGWTLRAAQAAQAVHKEALLGTDEDLTAARAALVSALEHGAAVSELAAYQARLAAAVWAAVEDDPPRLIERLGGAEE